MHNPVSALAHVGDLQAHTGHLYVDREQVPTGCPPVLSRLLLSRATKLDSSEPGSSRPARDHTHPFTSADGIARLDMLGGVVGNPG